MQSREADSWRQITASTGIFIAPVVNVFVVFLKIQKTKELHLGTIPQVDPHVSTVSREPQAILHFVDFLVGEFCHVLAIPTTSHGYPPVRDLVLHAELPVGSGDEWDDAKHQYGEFCHVLAIPTT